MLTWFLFRETLQYARPIISDRNIKYKAELVEKEEREEREEVYDSVRAVPVLVVDMAESVSETDDEYQC